MYENSSYQQSEVVRGPNYRYANRSNILYHRDIVIMLPWDFRSCPIMK